ncbi:hypothetical protein [Peribacillus loiseleuriae]|uniref:hypothetical protein n=1 Tax=Peribacillus loiseleuriae TaxID=1679170 RepID=UPI003D031A6A
MFNHFVKLNRAEVNKQVPRNGGVYIIVLRLFKDMDPVPVYVGSTGMNKTLAIRLKHYILIVEEPSRGRKQRPIERLIAEVPPHYLDVTYFCTEDHERIESLLINRNSAIHFPYLVNSNGIGRYRDTAHQIVDDLIVKISVLEKKTKFFDVSENLKGVQLVYHEGAISKSGTIVDSSSENNSFIICWMDKQIEEVTLTKFLYSSQYQFI